MFAIRKKKGKFITHFLDLFVKLAYLNIQWIILSLVGGIVLGVFPATFSIMKVARQWQINNDNKINFKRTWNYYKEEWIVANSIGWSATLLGVLFYMNFVILQEMDATFSFIVPIAFYILLFIAATVLLWFIPFHLHRYGTLKQKLKNSIVIGIVKLPLTLMMMGGGFIVMYISLGAPSLLLFFTFSLLCSLWMIAGLKGLDKITFQEIKE
jgi:uncharacterized membrane protein YesL